MEFGAELCFLEAVRDLCWMFCCRQLLLKACHLARLFGVPFIVINNGYSDSDSDSASAIVITSIFIIRRKGWRRRRLRNAKCFHLSLEIEERRRRDRRIPRLAPTDPKSSV